ncbi:hypothetical protein E9934_02255 [Nocardioides caeni]|uniref:Endonuclease/exonuclease/phosphatase domain-containing protein n=1 Tax=Nocardioides caeni TaxID=574700 RepID=A0A4S8NNG3_9ACTN|nr:endonuclease/exonuclease/phosphatase family protein [Nocardioides caeni]THV18467.1 hypothetical protein E9934_02255 [Nocardioides caeni]
MRNSLAAVLAGWCLLASGCDAGAGTPESPSAASSGADAAGSCEDAAPVVRRYADAVARVSVVSFNVDRTGRPAGSVADVRRLLRRDDVDVVGWQEADTDAFTRAAAWGEQRGWRTHFFDVGDGARQVPITWRDDRWVLVGVDAHPMVDGAGRDVTDHPFRPKWATAVTLRHRASGRQVTVLNTHVPNHVETGAQWEDNVNARAARQHYARLAALLGSPGDVRIATGDFQWDHHDDLAARPEGGITRTFAGRARNSFQALGLTGVCPTRNTRWIDYVWVDRPSLVARRAAFVTHRSLPGYASDHRPILATVALRRPN